MAGRDYILCRDCGDKLIYDGSDNIRSRLEQNYGDPSACDWTVELVCPPCLKKIEGEQQAEPVAWRTFDGEGGYDYRTYDDTENYAVEWRRCNPGHENWVEPLYCAPQQAVLKKDWPQAEEVAWMVYTEDGQSVYVTDNPIDIRPSQRALPLFTTPQQAAPEWAGLTNKEIYDCWPRSNEPIAIARAIEAAFKDKNT
jgi:hypothetical protein